MAVNTEGVLLGSFGGGIMEEKLVEIAKDKLKKIAVMKKSFGFCWGKISNTWVF
jgi:hypothetical protein